MNPISGRIYKTIDGGQSWVHQETAFSGFNETPAGVYFWNENEGVAFGATHLTIGTNQISVYRTENGGELWTKVVAPNFPAQLAGEGLIVYNDNGWFDVRGDYVWFQTNGSRIYRSADRGKSWTAHDTGLNGVSGLAFKDSLNGIAVRFSPNAGTRTSDGGLTWMPIPSWPSTPATTEIAYVPGTKGTYVLHASPVGSSAIVLVSYNDGSTWEILTTTPNLECIEFNSPTVGFAGGFITNATTGGIYKWTGAPLGNRLFVKHDATGANDGTSWANAFTDLQSALAAAEEGDQIWVAEGTYTPALPGGSQAATYLLDKNLRLYGGFVGTETALSQRGDPADHPTVLSGDLNGDDVPDNFVTNRADNVMTVVTMTSAVTNETVVDGFTIRNGHADGAGSDEAPGKSGGGVHAAGSPVLKQCIFTQNFAQFRGGGAYFNPVGAPVFENCHFLKNKCGNVGGGLSFQSPNGGSPKLTTCIFENNDALRGGGLSFLNCNAKVTGCSFLSNTSTQQAGGLFHLANQASGLTIEMEDCHFEDNHSTIGGGFFMESYDSQTNNNYFISNCNFIENSSSPIQPGWGQFGGGGGQTLSSSSSTTVIEDCLFSKNSSTAYAGGGFFLIDGVGSQFMLKNTTFSENTSDFQSAAIDIWCAYGGLTTVLIDNCHFENNISEVRGPVSIGCGLDGAPADLDVTLSNSTLKSNQAKEGGALWLWNDTGSKSSFTIENCTIMDNTASTIGGAMLITDDSPDFQVHINRSTITGNQSPDGGAIATQLALVNNVSILLENSLVATNSSDNGAFSIASTPDFHLLNCTVADNTGGGIQLADQSSLTLQNTILANPGHVEYTASANSTVTSHGGNLVLDSSLNDYLTTKDKPETEPDFMPGTYEPSSTSPLVNGGINDGVTALYDLAGNDRIQQGIVDIGAYESPFLPTSTREVIAGEVTVSPNPASSFLTIQLPEASIGTLNAQVFDAQGRQLRNEQLGTGQPLDVQALAPGMYSLRVVFGERVFVGKFVKK